MKRAAIAGVLALAVGAVGVGLFFRGQRSDVVSIATLPAYQDRALLERAWSLPVAKTFPRPLLSQGNPTVCGPASLANVLRSEGVATTIDRAAEAAGCTWGLCLTGRTLDQLAAGAKALGLEASVLRPSTVEGLREELRHANDPSRRYLVNFHRGPLFGRGGGHHSPIGGYLEDLDLVFVLDVNASYGPWLVPVERLFAAMNTDDDTSGQKRGLLLLKKT